MWLQIIYDMPKTLHQTLSLEAKKRGNYKWAFLEIKQYIAELGIHSVRSSQKTDFISQQAYDAWHTAEMETNIGLMKTMAARLVEN